MATQNQRRNSLEIPLPEEASKQIGSVLERQETQSWFSGSPEWLGHMEWKEFPVFASL